MIRVSLGNAQQEHVVSGRIPPFNPLPRVLLWGNRVFVLQKPNERPDSAALYVEAFAITLVDTGAETDVEGGTQ